MDSFSGKGDSSSLHEGFAALISILGAGVYAALAWILFLCMVAVFALGTILCRKPAMARRMAKALTVFLFRALGIRLAVQGLDRIPQRPHILLSNHTSFLDAIVLTALLPAHPGYTFTTRQEFRAQRLLCPMLRRVHVLVLQPPDSTPGTNIELMSAALRHGENLVVFPEGRFTSEPGLMPFHRGAFVVAARARVPIVVAGLRGARLALPLGTWTLRRKSISLDIGSVIQCTEEEPAAVHEASKTAYEAMLSLCDEPSSPCLGAAGY